MNLEKEIIEITSNMMGNDPSHDILHAKRVLKLCKFIAKEEGGDLEILIPCAIFHDVICYPKNTAKSKMSSIHSSEQAEKVLNSLDNYPVSKIKEVSNIIKDCSFSKNVGATSLEGKILQDADKLEAVGAIAIMRTFSSVGAMDTIFYNEEDPFCKSRLPEDKNYGLDLFFTRLLKIGDMLYTETAKEIAKERISFLHKFLKQLEKEI